MKSKPYHIIIMHLIYSALRPINEATETNQPADNTEIKLRHRAYLSACDKHRDVIKEIQKYFPNWMPRFR